MKKTILVLVLGMAVFSFSNLISTIAKAAVAAPKCNCTYPSTGEFGVRDGDDCPVVRCWVPIEFE